MITGSSFTDNGANAGERKIRISNYAAIGGGVVNFTVAGTDEKKFVISSDMQLFDHSKNYNGKQLETFNVTFDNVLAPVNKWWSLWDPEEDNAMMEAMMKFMPLKSLMSFGVMDRPQMEGLLEVLKNCVK